MSVLSYLLDLHAFYAWYCRSLTMTHRRLTTPGAGLASTHRAKTPIRRAATPVNNTYSPERYGFTSALIFQELTSIASSETILLPDDSKQMLEKAIIDILQEVSGSPTITSIAQALAPLADDTDVFNKAVDVHVGRLNLQPTDHGMVTKSIKYLFRFRKTSGCVISFSPDSFLIHVPHAIRDRIATINATQPMRLDPDNIPTPIRRPFRSSSGAGETVWYSTTGKTDVEGPPPMNATTGHLWLHRNTVSGRVSVWMFGKERAWESVNEGKTHPFVEDRILKMRKNGEPSWVTRSSEQTVRGRDTKKRPVSVPL